MNAINAQMAGDLHGRDDIVQCMARGHCCSFQLNEGHEDAADAKQVLWFTLVLSCAAQ